MVMVYIPDKGRPSVDLRFPSIGMPEVCVSGGAQA